MKKIALITIPVILFTSNRLHAQLDRPMNETGKYDALASQRAPHEENKLTAPKVTAEASYGEGSERTPAKQESRIPKSLTPGLSLKKQKS